MTAVAKQIDRYLPGWLELDRGVTDSGPLWLQARREVALTALMKSGLPAKGWESWKYSSVAPLLDHNFARQEEIALPSSKQLGTLGLSLPQGPVLVFINGVFKKDMSRLETLPKGVKVESFRMALKTGNPVIEKHVGEHQDIEVHPFAAFNTIRATDGAVIVLEKGVEFSTPIHIHYIADCPQGDIISHPRNLIVAEENSRGVIVESYAGPEGECYLTNAVTEVVLEPSAGLEYYKLQEESRQAFHVGALHVQQQAKSYFHSHFLSFGAAMSRHDIAVDLVGEGTDSSFNGLYVASGDQQVDHQLRVDHKKAYGTSRQLFKGVMDDRGRGIFNGKVVVHEGASQTNADQTNNNLLLSKDAEADPKPELEIYHSDVKCTHGATVGQLDETALFYLRSRGISLPVARQILTLAFAREVTEKIKLKELKESCECYLAQHLHGGQHG